MKKRIFIGMLALVLLILPVSLYLQINQAFRQSLESARNSALREESAIARALSMELQREDDRAGSEVPDILYLSFVGTGGEAYQSGSGTLGRE